MGPLHYLLDLKLILLLLYGLLIYLLYLKDLHRPFSLVVGDAMVVSQFNVGEKVSHKGPKFMQQSVNDRMMVVATNMG